MRDVVQMSNCQRGMLNIQIRFGFPVQHQPDEHIPVVHCSKVVGAVVQDALL